VGLDLGDSTPTSSTSCSTTSGDSTSGTRPRPARGPASGARGSPEARPGLVGADDPCPGLLVAGLRGSGCPTPTGGGGPAPHPERLAGTRCTARHDDWAGVADRQRGEEVDRIGPLRAVREHDLRAPPARRQGPPRVTGPVRASRERHPTSLPRGADSTPGTSRHSAPGGSCSTPAGSTPAARPRAARPPPARHLGLDPGQLDPE